MLAPLQLDNAFWKKGFALQDICLPVACNLFHIVNQTLHYSHLFLNFVLRRRCKGIFTSSPIRCSNWRVDSFFRCGIPSTNNRMFQVNFMCLYLVKSGTAILRFSLFTQILIAYILWSQNHKQWITLMRARHEVVKCLNLEFHLFSFKTMA